MSMEIFALSDRPLLSLADWQRSIDITGMSLVLPRDTSIDDLGGFLPVRLSGIGTGFECDHRHGRELMDFYGAIDFGRKWTYALAFNWHGFDEALAAYAAAAAYARAADGVVFDPQDGIVMSPQQAFEVVAKMKAELPKMKEALRAMSDVSAKPGKS
jgi:hypothetical protein